MKQTKRDIKIISFSDTGDTCAIKIANALIDIHEPVEVFSGRNSQSLKTFLGKNFNNNNIIVFVSSCDTAVRAISSFIKGKNTDPAVLVTDEHGDTVIALLAGRRDEANGFAQLLASFTGAGTVISIKREANKVPEIEAFARRNDLTFADTRKINEFSKTFAVLKKTRVMIPSDISDTITFSGRLPDEFEIVTVSKTGVVRQASDVSDATPAAKATSCLISPYTIKYRVLHMIPRCYVLSIDCPADADLDELLSGAFAAVKKSHIHMCAVKSVVAPKELKSCRPLKDLAKALELPFETFSPSYDTPDPDDKPPFTLADKVAFSAGAVRTVTSRDLGNGVFMSVGLTGLTLFA